MKFNAGEQQAATAAGGWGEAAHDAYRRMLRMTELAQQQDIPATTVYHVTSLPPRPGPAARLSVDALEVLVPCPLADHGDHQWARSTIGDQVNDAFCATVHTGPPCGGPCAWAPTATDQLKAAARRRDCR